MRWAGAVVVPVLVLLLGGCSADPAAPAPLPGPSAPYAHEPLGESSIAGPVSPSGTVGRLAGALAEAGFTCAQVRANDAAVQVWCRSATTVATDAGAPEPAVTVVDLVGTPDGGLQYGHVALPYLGDAFQATDQGQPDRLSAVLDASFLEVWPEDADPVHALVADIAAPPLGLTTNRFDSRPAERKAAPTPHARYTLGEVDPRHDDGDVHGYPALELTVTTELLQDRSWPFGSDSYARPIGELPELAATEAVECLDARRACVHQLFDGVDWTSAGDRILTVTFTAGGSDFTPATGFVPTGEGSPAAVLALLADDVRAAVADRLAQCRRTGGSFAGVVAGVLVTVDAHAGTPDPASGYFWTHFDATIGAPLVPLPSS